MDRNWTPESKISVTDTAIVIEIQMKDVPLSSVLMKADGNQLCVQGQHDLWGKFECRFDIPHSYSLVDAKSTFTKAAVLHIDLPRTAASESISSTMAPIVGHDVLMAFPRPMLIYCKECGKHFDIVLTSKEPTEHQCPGCGALQQFAFGAFVNQAIEQSKKMAGKPRKRC